MQTMTDHPTHTAAVVPAARTGRAVALSNAAGSSNADSGTASSATSAKSVPGNHRLTALDGLRGVAAFVVVLHHISLIATPYLQPTSGGVQVFSLWWWLEYSPLKLLTAGREAVLVFFVLSGLVVSLPAMRNPDFSWPGFFAGRFVRLYLPAWGALVLAGSFVLFIPRSLAQVTGGVWVGGDNIRMFNLPSFLSEMTLMLSGPKYDNVLWTLRWEVTFSVMLPILLVLAVALRRWWIQVAILTLGLAVLGTIIGLQPLTYLPVFFLGTLLGTQVNEIRTWGDRMTALRSRWVWTAVVVGSLLLLVSSFMLQGVVTGIGNDALQAMASAAAVGLVIAAIAGTWWRRLLERRAPQFLGRISFSLYLVHVPVIVTIAFLVGDWNWWLLLPLGVPAAILLAWAFNRFVELPLHRLARHANTAATRAVASYASTRA